MITGITLAKFETFYLKKIREDVPFDISMIFLAETISAAMMQIGQKLSKVRMIKLPVPSVDLFKMVQDISTDFGPGKYQAHPRYMTNQNAVLRSDFSVGKMDAAMKNLSLSGAYFEALSNSLGLKAGDFVKFAVSLGPSKKEYVFDAKVVWVKNLPDAGCGFGVTFVDKEEVYNHLLKGL